MEMRIASGVPTVKTTFSGGLLAQAGNPEKTASKGALERKNRARRREKRALLEQLSQLVLKQRVEAILEDLAL